MATKIICTTPKAITGDLATFAIETDLVAPYKFHWKKNGALIAGSPSAKTYTTPPMQQEDMLAKFSVVVYGQNNTEESNEIGVREVAAKTQKGDE